MNNERVPDERAQTKSCSLSLICSADFMCQKLTCGGMLCRIATLRCLACACQTHVLGRAIFTSRIANDNDHPQKTLLEYVLIVEVLAETHKHLRQYHDLYNAPTTTRRRNHHRRTELALCCDVTFDIVTRG